MEIAEIPIAHLSTKIDELVVMVLHGELADLLTLGDTALYRKYVVIDINGKPILYMKLQKALCGHIRAILLFYEKVSQDLKAMGLIIITYETYLANTMFNGKI